jgi:tRNA uridine 5-carboxymethylaminomethyl modification enzyme
LEQTRQGSDSLTQILRRPEVSYGDLPQRNEALSLEEIQQVEIIVKYAGYINRQQLEVDKFKKLEDKQFPDEFDYLSIPSLRTEARQKLNKIRPATLGQAARISGVSPADISILLVWLKRGGQPGIPLPPGSEVEANKMESGEPE